MRFCSEPSEDSTFSVMRLRARMVLYFCAAFQKVLPSGPVVIVSVLGGAGWIRRTATQIATAAISRIGPNETARSRQEIATKRATSRGGGLRPEAGFIG